MIPNTIKETDIDFLTKREKEKCVEMFNCFDKNGSKLLEKQELIIALQGKLLVNQKSSVSTPLRKRYLI